MGTEESPGDIPEHYNPIGKAQTLAQWRKLMRMPVFTSTMEIVDLIIVHIYETTAVNGLPLDFLIDARQTLKHPIKHFGVVFSKHPPDWHSYDIPVLWREDGKEGLGRWK